MQPVITLFSIFSILLMSYPLEAKEEVCLTLDRQTVVLKNLVNMEGAVLSEDGRYLLYEEKLTEDPEDKKTAIIFLDLKTQEKKELLRETEAEQYTNAAQKYFYGFSKDGKTLFGFANGEESFKVWRLPELEESFIPIAKDRVVLSISFMEDGKLISTEMEKETWKSMLPFKQEAQHIVDNKREEVSATAHIFEYYNSKLKSRNYFHRVVDPFTLNQSETVFPAHLPDSSCSAIDDSLKRVLRVHQDGTLTGTKLTGDKKSEEIFGPIKGFEPTTDPIETIKQCVFLSKSLNIIYLKKEEKYIVRDLKEKEEFLLPADFFVTLQTGEDGLPKLYKLQFDYLDHLKPFITYPFAITPRYERIFHIPSGQVFGGDNNIKKMELALEGRASLETHEENGQILTKVVSHPFSPYQRKTIFEMDKICHKFIDDKTGLATLLNFDGSLFTVNTERGIVRQRLGFLGQCFLKNPVISKNGTAFLGLNRQGEPVIHRLYEECVEPESPTSITTAERLAKLSQAENPLQPSHLSFLTSLLSDANNFKNHLTLLEGALWNILLHSPVFYLELHRQYPDIGQLPVSNSYPDFGPDTKSRLLSSAQSVLHTATSTIRYTRLDQWNFLRMLKPLLKELPKEDQDLYMERITVSVSNGAAQSIPLLQDVFQSKIYYVIKGHVKKLFGFEPQPVSDISVIRKPGELVTVILSSDLIEGYEDVSTDFGLHYAVVNQINYTDLENQKELILDGEWSLSKEKSYRAKVQVHVKSKIAFMLSSSPNYESIWQDHKMVGVMVIGSSLSYRSGALTKEYLSYFHDEGFQFISKETTDSKKFLLEKIKNCEVDYFLKESHSDGDERNVFRLNRENHILQGVRYGESGQIEVIYLVFPKTLNPVEENSDTELLSNRELSQAIAERENNDCGQLTYFNTSCWSHVKARYEIEAVNSFLFLNIPSLNLSDTFVNSEDSAIRVLLDSYRKGLDFKQFREALTADKGYASGKSRNHYIFPDEPIYSEKILKPIIPLLDIKVQLEHKKGEVWQTINPDEAL